MVEQPPPGAEDAAAKAEAASAGMLLQALGKAAKGFTIYLPNNPLHGKFFEDLDRRVVEHLEEFGPLRLDIEHDSIRCRGRTIYENPELRENLAFRMYADGMRGLILDERLETRELRAFVEIVGMPPAEDAEDDIVTRLWSADLPHLTYFLAELPPVSGPEELGIRPETVPLQDAVRRAAARVAAEPPPPPPPPLPPGGRIFALEAAELARLEEEVRLETGRTPIEDVSAMLGAVLAAERDLAFATELADITARLCADLLLIGGYGHAAELARVLGRAASLPGTPPETAAMLRGRRATILSEDVVEALGRDVVREPGIGREDLQGLVEAFGTDGISPFCRVLGQVPDKETRRTLIDALAEAGREAPELFYPFLDDGRWFLVRNTIYILRQMGGPEAARAVIRCAAHRDPRVRKEALLLLDTSAAEEAEPALLRLIEDETPALRAGAARALARRGSRAAADRLLALARSPGFGERERQEREAVYEALADLAPGPLLELCRELLGRRRWFAASREVEETAQAVAGLRRLATPRSVALIKEAAASKRGEARELAQRALRALARTGVQDPRGGADERG